MATLTFIAPVIDPPSGALFFDGLESGNRTHTDNGISWGGSTVNVEVSTAKAYAGTHSIIMPMGPGAPGGQASAEQDFLTPPMTEIWVSYWIWIPANYYQREQDVGSNNNKGFLYLWNGDYSGGNGPGIGPNFFTGSALPNIVLEPGESRQKCYVFNGDGFDFYVDGGDPALMAYGIVDADRGQWEQIVTHAKYATAANNDGVYRNWKRHDGDPSFTQLLNLTAIPMYVAGATGFDHGRILGYANSGFTELTEFFVDNFEVRDSPDPSWGIS